MDAIRFKKVEKKLVVHERRHDDSDRRHEKTASRLAEAEKLVFAIQESTKTQEKMIEVGENIITALGWVAKIAKWIVTMIAFFTATYHFIKIVREKILVMQW
jgi:hypothetical protein